MNRIDIHIIDLANSSFAEAEEILSEVEQVRAARFRFENDRRSWIASRVALRCVLAGETGRDPRDVPLGISPTGKPLLEAPWDSIHFNLSHCAGRAVIAVSREHAVGIDIEPLARGSELCGCEESFCHPSERAALPREGFRRASELLRIWTAKEAALKAVGCGLEFPPDALRIVTTGSRARPKTDIPSQAVENQHIFRLSAPSLDGYSCFLATASPQPEFGFTDLLGLATHDFLEFLC